jgi:hypothetical protein
MPTLFPQGTESTPTDILQLDGHLLEEVVPQGYLLTLLLIGQDHLAESIAQHEPALFDVATSVTASGHSMSCPI